MTGANSLLSTWHGISVGSLITGTGAWAAVGTLIGIVLKGRVPMRKMKIEADENFRIELVKRVEKLEADLTAAATLRETERKEHEAVLAMMRHRLNNSDQSIEALLLILDDDDLPDRLKMKVGRIRELRARQKEAEERERDTIRAAGLAAKAQPLV